MSRDDIPYKSQGVRLWRTPQFLNSSSLLLLLTLASYLSETLVTVYGTSTPRLKGNFSLFATGSADYFCLLAWPFGSSVAPLPPS